MTAAERTEARNRERDRKDGRTDFGALEPCGYCGEACEPGTCAAELEAGQLDIFGGTQSPEAEPPEYQRRDAGVPQGTQSRLFEPQMEGQLALDGQLPIEGK